MAVSQDMTAGSPRRLMTRFALPILMSYVFQQLYSVADGFVVGRLIGVDALASVGATGFYSWMVLSVIIGFTQGFGVMFATCFGAKDEDGIRKAILASIWLCAAIGAALTALGMLLAPAVLKAVNTPPELMESALAYLNWILGGTLVSIGYNLIASILRSFGNSRTPLVAVVISGLLSLALNFIVVGLLGMGVAAVAMTTVIAQAFSLFYCLWALRGEKERLFAKGRLTPDRAALFGLLRLGAPVALRNGVISTGGLLVQNAINQYGTLVVAGIAAAGRYFGLMEMVCAGLEGAVATFVGQNAGQNNLPRIREGIRFARQAGLVASVIILTAVTLLARPLIGFLISASDPLRQAGVLDAGQRALTAMAVCLPALYMLCIHRAAAQGMGNALFPMLTGFVELAFRVLCVFTARWLGVWPVYFANGAGWIGAMILICIAWAWIVRVRKREITRLTNAKTV